MTKHEPLTREQHKALIDAANLICEHVQGRLKPGWMIRLEMDSEEATLELFDGEGNEVSDIDSESGVSQIDRLCGESWREDEDRIDDDSPRGMGWVGYDGLP